MQDFINPKSMMTPGIAGGMMMFIVNGVAFAFPELPARILALILSFLIGSIVFTAQSKTPSPIWAKGVYWVVNSLIIFVVGFGTAHLAADNNSQTPNNTKSSFLIQPFITSAYAQTDEIKSTDMQENTGKTKHKLTLEEQLQIERENNAALAKQLEKMKTSQTESAAEPAKASSQMVNEKSNSKDSTFFKQW